MLFLINSSNLNSKEVNMTNKNANVGFKILLYKNIDLIKLLDASV
jgi:hypothetical protein